MKIDISRVNLLEKDIEDWLYRNPHALGQEYMGDYVVDRWIGRQYSLPSGIADLIGVGEKNLLVVAEVKNVPINKAAVLQVCRYAADLSDIVGNRDGYHRRDNNDPFYVKKVLVGPSIDDQTFLEATACDVRVIEFEADLRLTLGALSPTREAYERRQEQLHAISLRDEWSIFGIHYSEYNASYSEAELAATPQPEESQDQDSPRPGSSNDGITKTGTQEQPQ
jgi:hypothetical protein